MTPLKIEKQKVKLPWWRQLLRVIFGILLTMSTSQLLSTDPNLDKAIKSGIIAVGSIALDAMTSYSLDTLKIDTVQVASTSISDNQTK
jgi:hypothetical protein